MIEVISDRRAGCLRQEGHDISTSGSRPPEKHKPHGARWGAGHATFMLIWAALAAALSGCGGRAITNGWALELAPATSWVFDAGSEIALAWHMFPVVEMATIDAGAQHGENLVVLCNLGGRSEDLRPSHAYVIRLDDGRILTSIRGPTGLDWPPVVITERYAYYRHVLQWGAFDLLNATVTHTPPVPPPPGLPLARDYAEISHEERDGKHVWRYQLNHKYCLQVAGKRGGKLSFDLLWASPSGEAKQSRLCQLPSRMDRGWSNLVFVDNKKKLVFSWWWYLICVDLPDG